MDGARTGDRPCEEAQEQDRKSTKKPSAYYFAALNNGVVPLPLTFGRMGGVPGPKVRTGKNEDGIVPT